LACRVPPAFYEIDDAAPGETECRFALEASEHFLEIVVGKPDIRIK